jgi:hypothetical protein
LGIGWTLARQDEKRDLLLLLQHNINSKPNYTMVSFSRLVLCSLLSVCLFVGNAVGEDAIQQNDPSQQRRQLWDFMTFVSLRT